jgi:hypothetical protein
MRNTDHWRVGVGWGRLKVSTYIAAFFVSSYRNLAPRSVCIELHLSNGENTNSTCEILFAVIYSRIETSHQNSLPINMGKCGGV